MTVAEIITLISNVGAGTVVVAFAIYYFLHRNKQDSAERTRLLQDKNELLEKLGEKDKTIATLSAVRVASIPVHHTPEQEEQNTKEDSIINQQLKVLSTETKCSRSGVFLYHNGGNCTNGRYFQKMSLFYEYADLLTPSILQSFQNLPRTFFPTLPTALVQNHHLCISELSEIQSDDFVSFKFLHERGVHSFCAQALIDDVQNIMLGFVFIEYLTNDLTSELKKTAAVELDRAALKISGVLQVSDQSGGE